MLWDEYIERHPDGYRYSRFCEDFVGHQCNALVFTTNQLN